MRTEDFKRGVISILLVLCLVFSMILVAPPASPGDLIYNPGGEIIEVAQGDTFLIRHTLEWNEPENGAYSVTMAWDCYDNEPSQNFTFVGASAYFTTGDYVGESILAIATLGSVSSPDYPGSTRYILKVECPAKNKDPRNGQFNVDITLGAYGAGGVPHIPGDHVIPWQFGGIAIVEKYPKSWNRDLITIRVLAKLISISPNYQSGLPGTALEYTVTVTNVGENEDNFDLTVSDSENWGPTLDDHRFENIPPGENRQTTLGVTIPENAVPYSNIITVTATSQENADISDNASCMAYVLKVIIEGKSTAYNLNFAGPPPWVWYDNNPPILAAGRVGDGAIVAGGTVCTCRNIRWNLGEWDIFLDSAFQWMVPGATNVLWYEGYDVYNDTLQCSDLIDALESLGYSVTGDDTEPITSSLLSPYDILVIPQFELGNGYIGGDPSLLPDADVDAIVHFVEAGGGLLIMDGTDYFGYNFNRVHNKILQAFGFGLIFQSDSVYDDTNNQGAAFEPWCDVDTTTWIGSAYENETGESEIGLYSLCSLAPPPPAGFAPPHADYGLDTDNDNLYNYLVVEVNVSVDNAGWYHVFGNLHDTEWDWITNAWADNYLDVGTQTLELRFNGWHINSSGRDGPYRVHMELFDDEGNRIDTDQHETAFYAHDQFQPPPAKFAPPYSDYGLDTDNDNLYNYLVVEVNVSVDNAGWYRVDGSLNDSEWNWITNAWADNYLDVGTHMLELRFNGWHINSSGRDGPYRVHMELYDDEENRIDTDQYETAFYDHDQFQPPPARFDPPHSDYGLDTDNDNLYNYLVVEVNVSVDAAGWYSVYGHLHDSVWNWVAYTWVDNYLDVGTHTLELRFIGWHINRSGRDGPYRVHMELYDDEGNRIDTDQHETAFYAHDQFQPPPARFDPPHSDYGLDTDNDNLYNYLVVEVNVSVDNAGWYHVQGNLHDSEWNWITEAWADDYLDVGTQTLELRFIGWHINSSGRDGPYHVYLNLHDDEGNWLDYDEHETAFYTHDQFQLPSAWFAPPHSDYGLDTDNDNLYNYLAVEVNVSVDNAGWYHVYSGLHDSEWNWITEAWADNYLDVGTHMLELRFIGWHINSSGGDGPYHVSLNLHDDEGNWIDYDEHETAFYAHDQFQPSGFILDWLLVGPFSPNGYYVTYTDFLDGEADVAPRAGDVVGSMTWFEHHDSDAYIDFNSLFSPNDDVCAYAFAYVHSPSTRQAQLRVGSDDGVMVWLNGVRVLDSQVMRGAAPDQDIVSVMLDGGWNRLLVKVGEWYGEWGFYLRFTDAAGRPITDLTIALEPPPLIWDALIVASFTHGSDDAIFGVRPDATYGFDSEYDIPEAPAPVAPPYVRTFFYYPEQTPDELHRSCLGLDNLMEWPLRIEYTEALEDITLTWDVEDVSTDYFILLYRGENFVADMRAEDNYTFEASTGSYDFRIVVGTAMPFTLELTRGWNMISFPVLLENMSPDSIFDGYYVLYRWDAEAKRYVLHADSGSYIEPDPDVEAGVGYWIHVLRDENVALLGDPVNELTLDLRQGWNLVGPPYGSSNIVDPADDPDGSVITWAFTWDAEEKSYRMTQQLEAGKGYWINALRNCTLELP